MDSKTTKIENPSPALLEWVEKLQENKEQKMESFSEAAKAFFAS